MKGTDRNIHRTADDQQFKSQTVALLRWLADRIESGELRAREISANDEIEVDPAGTAISGDASKTFRKSGVTHYTITVTSKRGDDE